MKALGNRDWKAPVWPPIYALLLVLILLWAVGEHAVRGQTLADEYRVKAAFLYHFAQLVDWPLGVQKGEDHSLLLCTLGEDPFHGALEGTIQGKVIGTRVMRIRHLKDAASMPACQILFLGREQGSRIPLLLAALHNAPTLTVGETEGFLGAGGMICFSLVENKLRFAINLDAAQAASLRIGSRLLVLATNLTQGNRER